ncbi:MAG: DinB family protein [Phycisphaerales bacterium]|jgi:hypothetical protein|nr:DinB family protein [Phycisphaerales bacterium]
MSSTAVEAHELARPGLASMELSRGLLSGLVKDLEGEALFKTPCSGGNHAAWVMGHIAVSEDYFRSTISGTPSLFSEPWGKLFGINSECVADASKYPSKAELAEALERSRAAFVSWASGLDEAGLRKLLPENLKQFGPDVAGMIAKQAFHEGFHTGQVSVARRAQGMARLF